MNQITHHDFGLFETELLSVDFISFNIKRITSQQITRLASYFQNLGFNSYQKQLDSNQSRQDINDKNNPYNQFEVYFIMKIPYQKEIIQLQFPGVSGKQFYKLIKQRAIQWEKLPNPGFSRLDLVYQRISKSNDPVSTMDFINSCYIQFQELHSSKNLLSERNQKGLILKIGNRKSSNFYRIYQTKNGLRFELEIKKNQIKQVTNLLFCYDIKQFEETLTKHFYTHSKKVLTFDDCYTDWLIQYFRKNRKLVGSLATSYLEEIDPNDFVTVFSLLQFLTFSRNQKYIQVQMYDQIYYLIEFNLKEYMEFSGVKNTNQYQRHKFINLFYSFQKMQPLITYFTEAHFQSILTFPYINIQKQGNSWVVKVAVSKLLYKYRYPFSFPNTFLTYKNIYDLKVKIEVIQAISKVPLEKVFYVEVFLEQFNVPTKTKAIIKKQIVKTFNHLQTVGVIKNDYKLIKKNYKN